MRRFVLLVLASTTVTACAPGFRAIAPGMDSAQVSSAMGTGPSQVVPYNDGYATWYYGPDQCLLVRNNVVVAKDVTHRRGGISIPGVGGLSVNERAQCVPPGVQADPNETLNVGVRGVHVNVR